MSKKVIDETKKVNDETTGKRDFFQWNAQMDVAFLDSMIREQNNGNRIDGNFTTQAYNNMVNDLNAKFEKQFNTKYLHNRLKTLKKNFAKYYDIFRGVALSGFSWNSETKLLETEDEVWTSLIDVCFVYII